MARKTKAKKKPVKPNAEYKLPEKSGLKPDTVRYLGLDPGIKNHGISLVACRGTRVKVMANSIVTKPMNNMTEYSEQMVEYLAEIRRWVKLYKPDAIIAERFMVRGAGIGQAMVELVSSMIAAIAREFKIPIWPIPAAQWKVPLQKRFGFDLKEMYKQALTEAHPLDATFIGIYGLEKKLGIELKFDPEDILSQVEDTSLLPLKEKKQRR